MGRILLTAVLLASTASVASADRFGDHWYDGQAELCGYRLVVERYGEARTGTAVMVFVTEPFSESKRVKVEDHRAHPEDVVTVMKPNLVRDFQTGIYDYNVMTSVFSEVDAFEPLKVTFTSAEWCGHVYAELIYRDRITGFTASYFERTAGILAPPWGRRRGVPGADRRGPGNSVRERGLSPASLTQDDHFRARPQLSSAIFETLETTSPGTA